MLRRHPGRLSAGDETGFTLVELLVSLVLLGAIVTAWSGLMTTTVKSSGRTQELSTLQTEVQGAVDTLSADLRQALCNGTTTPVTTATGTQLTFYSPDRATPYHLRQVSYRLSNGELDRAVATSTNTGGPPWTIPALGAWVKQVGSIVNTPAFAYRDANGAATTNATKVASTTVTLTIAPAKGLGGTTSTSQTNIELRTASCQ